MQSKELRQTLIIIISLLALLPSLFLMYIFFDQQNAFALPNLFFLAIILGLAIIAIIKIHNAFAGVSATAEALRKAVDSREKLPKAGITGMKELADISEGFNCLMEQIEKTTESLNRRDLELNSIRELSGVSDRIQNIEEVPQQLLLDKSMTVTNSLIGSIFLHDPAASRLRMTAARGLKSIEENYSVDINDSLMRTVVSDRKPLIVQNIEDDPRTRKTNDPRYGAPSFVSMPILMENEVIAVLNLSHKEKNHSFDANDERILSILVDEIGLALEKVSLRTNLDMHVKKLEERDILLGLENADRLQAEENWKRYKFIVDISKRFLTLINRDYVYEAASDAFCRAHNLIPDKVIGRTVADIWGQEDFHNIIKAFLDSCFSGEEITYDKSFEFPALGLQHFSVSYWPYYNNDGVITHAVVFNQNITERKKLEAQLSQAHKLEALGTLAGGIAHDFNNLLMAIQGHISLILMGMDSHNPDYEKLKAVEKQIIAGVNLTRQLLGFARGGKYEVKPLNINEVLEQTSTMFGRTRRQIQIHKNFQEDIWPIEADLNQIEQVLLNLYLNAWQAMPGGGNLFIKTAKHTVKEVDKINSHMKPGKYVKISITDTGVGMDENTKQRIFEPFFTTREIGLGTGLGLAMVYGIIKNHDGYITVYSEKGHGTNFTIYIPASEKIAVPVREEQFAETILRGQETILLVDDEEHIINVMKEIMEMLGYNVMVADNGWDAIKVYKENKEKIDLVILDMIMPDMGGGETFNGLKQINPQVKVILSSGYSLNSEAAGIMARGCKGFLQKPVNIAILSQKIRDVFEK